MGSFTLDSFDKTIVYINQSVIRKFEYVRNYINIYFTNKCKITNNTTL